MMNLTKLFITNQIFTEFFKTKNLEKDVFGVHHYVIGPRSLPSLGSEKNPTFLFPHSRLHLCTFDLPVFLPEEIPLTGVHSLSVGRRCDALVATP